ncbi:SDR family NAD(P)-dependent oxidoreductase [Brevibacillus laterosporus]|uniref:SDR family NAD(P)-dependent oxidoreductase n=1 Tax=Brevibacillus laterosporus TaxID=1465 RepID=UPI001CA5E464|nr:SDR family NAD(P)-dependent oxidoreductase [Brevibacillus laterosporus]
MEGIRGGSLQMRWGDELLYRLLWGQLQSMGLFTEKRSTIAALKAKIGLRDLYNRWFEESIAAFERNGYLEADGESITVADWSIVYIHHLWKEWDQQKENWLMDSNTKAQVILVETTLRALPDILRGRIPATDIMFPNSSMALVEGIYKNNLVADHFNEVLADIVVAYVQERLKQDESAKIRILEIGAGTGGTSAMVFKKLKPYQACIEEYCYTDLSRAFLMHAEKEYGPDNPYLKYQIFDLEKPIAKQGVPAGEYELIIATNVLHATKQIRQTLRNAKAVLKKNGLILINELSDSSLFTHLTFGLLEGWWRYEDPELRIPGCPGMYPETWKKVLENEGFHSIFFPADENHDWGQQIIVAESDGVVRQQQNEAPINSFIQSKKDKRPSISLAKSLQPKIQNKGQISIAGKEKSAGEITEQTVKDHVKETIKEQLSVALKVDSSLIDDDESFADYGVDSILGVHLVRLINDSLAVELDTTSLFDYSCVNQLTAYILSTFKEEIAKTLEELVSTSTGSYKVQLHDSTFTHNQNEIPASYQVSYRFNSEQRESKFRSHQEPDQTSSSSKEKDRIAIIGMSGRFAQSNTLHELWEHIARGDDLIGEISRWDISTNPSWEKQNACKYGSFLDDIDRFDPMFFNISGLEATYMDPQQRLFLEESWKALEDAGYAGEAVSSRKCGIYVGCCGSDYSLLFDEELPAQSFWGNAASVIPARIAYYLNLQGPAVTVDTACSSSLTAIHLACQGLWSHETEMALAGGVFVQSTPLFYENANRAGMLSPTGRCYTFDERADGFVPGEGVGVVVLKRLQDAIADGDHIYGVICGSGLNQDGTTNGITAPSANSQERLECQIYDSFTINPEQIQMVEAHGTGTKLGDPIEFQALTRAFRRYTDKKQYCAIGSIKTNIGHTTAAAGVAGVIKILLSLQHKQIPPSLHYQAGNSNIRFEESPFYVNTALSAWNVESSLKRCAVVSSFGFSGTNAHMVIEEPPQVMRYHENKPSYIISVSARSADQLRQQVEQLIHYAQRDPEVDLGNMSYTLLLGRKQFHHRLAFVVETVDELIKLLRKWLEKGKAPQIYQSELGEKEYREQFSLKSYGDECIQQCVQTDQPSVYLEHLSVVAELYVQGYTLKFERLFAEGRYSRISLPTYPFVRERYWVSAPKTKSLVTRETIKSDVLHPLLHQNTSTLSLQRFRSTLIGNEFFLADHVVKGQRLLPGVAYLEMARAAMEAAVEDKEFAMTGMKLKNIIWIKPITVDKEPVQIHIGLFPEETGGVTFEIYSETDEVGSNPVLHSTGIAVFEQIDQWRSLDIQEVRTQCTQGLLTSAQCYEAFMNMDINYGSGHQGVQKVYVGEGRALAELLLPESVSITKKQFVLHPSLMDAALQAATLLLLNIDGTNAEGKTAAYKLPLPFALQELEIVGECVPRMWAYIRYSEGSHPRDKLPKLDIDLCDDQGTVCVRMSGYSSRAMEEDAILEASCTQGTLMLIPEWKEQVVQSDVLAPEYVRHLVFLCEPRQALSNELQAIHTNIEFITLYASEKAVHYRFQAYAQQVLEEIQKVLIDKPKGKVLIQIVVRSHQEQRIFTGLIGLLKTAQLENPNVIGQVIEIAEEGAAEILNQLKENQQSPQSAYIRYQEEKRLVAGVRRAEASYNLEKLPWKENGVYLITGGAGGLGLIFAKEIASRSKKATIILAGRSTLSLDKVLQLKEIQESSSCVEYQQVDISKKEEVENLIQWIQKNFGRLDGIIHSAGIIKDNFIFKKNKEELGEVLAPKVSGLVNLDEATKHMDLDIFVLFSSIVGYLGNSGQADYSTANAFMDAYARYRNELVMARQRQGHTVSINWPLWQEGGMRAGNEAEKQLMNSIGMLPMSTSTGINAFYQGIAVGESQIMFMDGHLEQLQKVFFDVPSLSVCSIAGELSPKQQKTSSLSLAKDQLHDKVILLVKKLLSSVIKLPVNRIEENASMEIYGIDSIMVMDLTAQLEKTFGTLPKTLFFEFQNIRELAEYFIDNYEQQCLELLGMGTGKASEVEIVEAAMDFTAELKPAKVSLPRNQLHRNRHQSKNVDRREDGKKNERKSDMGLLDIAIIGVSGRYPGAKNVQKFWEHLRDGKDCITEIPQERWDSSLYYEKDKMIPGKTNSKWGGFIEGVDQFDPLFFNISPRDAELMDPQERIFLECVYETLEDAGYTRHNIGKNDDTGIQGNVGVFVGVMYEEYQLYGIQETMRGNPIALGGNPASIANRVSYFCNFNGPSVAIDTMCSSSLTSIHFACQSLQRGECEAAVAGGVNISIHPNKYLLLSQGNFVSSKGRCESFGQGGDGYVPGEGVGAILLKPLTKAIADGDQIYGVIKGTAINHGGKTNGYYVPNPNAQANVIGKVYEQAGITCRAVSYIEAHGTGTSLGDPIEIAGLTKAFRKYTKDNQFCAIGSAKSNIGHCESAAGIAAITKVLLQLKYGMLVPSLHSKGLNPNIDFTLTPFIVQQELSEWKRPIIDVNGESKEYPRIAGISSFGAGGSNAHVIIEEYAPKDYQHPSLPRTQQSPAIIVLSAKNEERLRLQIQRLLAEIGTHSLHDKGLSDIAYTLQVGRESMEERLAVIVSTIQELEVKLTAFLRGQENIEDLYRGQVKRNKDALAIFAADDDLHQAINAWIDKRKYDKLLDLWVKGLVVDWDKLYIGARPRRISLPTYPFERERYWIPGAVVKQTDGIAHTSTMNTYIHPLLHQNTSNFLEQSFRSTFTGKESFLAKESTGQRVLTGAACFEMVRAAIEESVGHVTGEQTRLRLTNVEWKHPIVIDGMSVGTHISLFPKENGEIVYKIYHGPQEGNKERSIYGEGKAVWNPAIEVQKLDLQVLKAQCNEIVKQSSTEYDEVEQQWIETVYSGIGQALMKLSCPASIFGKHSPFILHPTMMDSILQTASIVLIDSDHVYAKNSKIPFVSSNPFALQELEVMKPCTPDMWAFVRYSDGGHAKDKAQKLDIDLCDEQGVVCVRMKGFSSRVLEGEFFSSHQEGEAASSKTSEEPLIGLTTLVPVWDAVSLEKGQEGLSSTDRVVIVGGTQDNHMLLQQSYPHVQIAELRIEDSIDEMAQTLKAYGRIDHVVWIAPCHSLDSLQEDDLIKEQNAGVMQAFQTIKALLQLGYGTKKLSWSVITVQTQPIHYNDSINPTHASLHGLIGSMAKEYPNWHIRLLDVEEGCDWPLTDMFTLPVDAEGNAWVYRNEEWYRQKLIPAQGTKQEQTKYRHGGIYVVIGGTGGIGEVWSEYMIRTYQAQIIWIGRREKDASLQDKIDRLASLGPEPFYIAADAKDRVALERAYKEIKERFTHIHGVIHSAIVLLDQSLERMDEERFYAGLSAKVDVSVRMAQVFGAEPLDFVLFFSSMNSFFKSSGQSNYVAGCTFKDAFAHQLAREWPCQVKVMNWGYWGSVGIVASDTYKKRMAQAGIGSIEPAEAMEALEALLAGSLNQVALLKVRNSKALNGMRFEGSIQLYPEQSNVKIESKSLRNRIVMPSIPIQNDASYFSIEEGNITTQSVTETVKNTLMCIAAEVINVKREDIDPDTELSEYGFDSIKLDELSKRINQRYHLEITATLFLEHSTLTSFGEYLVEQFEQCLKA